MYANLHLTLYWSIGIRNWKFKNNWRSWRRDLIKMGPKTLLPANWVSPGWKCVTSGLFVWFNPCTKFRERNRCYCWLDVSRYNYQWESKASNFCFYCIPSFYQLINTFFVYMRIWSQHHWRSVTFCWICIIELGNLFTPQIIPAVMYQKR